MVTKLKDRPVIAYPCEWSYKLFGTDQDRMREAVAQTLKGKPHTLTLSHSSTHKKYHCLQLDVPVRHEGDRNEIFQALASDRAFVLIV